MAIIIPTLNEEALISGTINAVKALRRPPGLEIDLIVVDGGSIDETTSRARLNNARVFDAEQGRGAQLAAGAARTDADILWFLHADTTPPDDALERIVEALDQPDVSGGRFRIRFDGPRRAARFLSWLYPSLRWLGVCYGDSAIFTRRITYDRVGGFRPYPIFEDLDFVRRLRRAGRFVLVDAVITTSSRRFEDRSFAATFARWSVLQGLYWLGISPYFIGRHYPEIRGRGRS